ncbi:hypothetical protein BS329_28085 [Amycolatopsis coloradensis]|uniref:Heparin-binding hemagglutinin n=1 Tax=Amycolatopsis coloradensis TaxID=76021 RepID=A0A1R0KM78_9PSEU|nr:hypothetical protein [Amycolatopsis coloradensis]OLZ47732.1 hypothetical protein BS329_28085 [Amycolatopsis coloradensis]
MTTATNTKTDRKHTALDQVRTPLLAALGAGNLAGQAVVDAVAKAKEKVVESGEAARKNIEELPHDVEGLREKLDPAELRKVIDEYTEAALKLYNKLAESGEQAWDKIAAQPQVKKAIEQLEDATADTRERIDTVLGKVTKGTRSVGEKTARKVSEVAVDIAGEVEEIGDDLAHETRSASRKAANKTAPKTTPPVRRTTTSPVAKKPATAPKTTEK